MLFCNQILHASDESLISQGPNRSKMEWDILHDALVIMSKVIINNLFSCCYDECINLYLPTIHPFLFFKKIIVIHMTIDEWITFLWICSGWEGFRYKAETAHGEGMPRTWTPKTAQTSKSASSLFIPSWGTFFSNSLLRLTWHC